MSVMKPTSKNISNNLFDKMRRSVEAVAYGNPLYQKMLASGSDAPPRLHFTLPDRWPGDAAAGLALMNAPSALFDRPLPPRPAAALRNLRAVGSDAARVMACELIGQWLRRYDQWNDVEWAPDVLGERVSAWIGFYEFYALKAPADFIQAVTASLQRQYKHLQRTITANLTGLSGLRSIKGLVLCALNFDDGDKVLGLACELLIRLLETEILPDGGVISRSPSAQLHMLRMLIDLRVIFTASGIEAPAILNTSINAMVPALKLFRHGDGGLALFHGGSEETALLIDAVITQSEAKGRVARRLADTGYERLTAGRSLLIADCGAPPPRGYDATGHAGLLSFEFGCGRERIIVNCGEVEGASGDWRTACAATAAHSTVTIEDTNACGVVESGGIHSMVHVTAQRFEQDGMHCLDLSHNGYVSLFGITCQRKLCLSDDGEKLHGVEILSGSPGRNFVLRWHLHPSLDVSLTVSGQTALLRTPSGIGWRLRIEARNLSLESGIYCGSGSPRRSLQLKTHGITDTPTTEIVWTLTRERKTPA